jgi:hypothetical protein
MTEGTGSSSGPDPSGQGPSGGGSSGPDPGGPNPGGPQGPSKPDPSKLVPSGMTQSTSMNSMSSESSYTENDLKIVKETNLQNYKIASDDEKAKLYKESQDELEAVKLAYKRYKASTSLALAVDFRDDPI